ncbi:hypothetical protein BKA66DRAFT_51985 [Pyrenochaeta sp. MPI-SDFR-AT-0127]|nr:hypothetical protein BKA66DRAFT_51985 [Pyrenochaeta sp. MPI-SDFR-AT-0127]
MVQAANAIATALVLHCRPSASGARLEGDDMGPSSRAGIVGPRPWRSVERAARALCCWPLPHPAASSSASCRRVSPGGVCPGRIERWNQRPDGLLGWPASTSRLTCAKQELSALEPAGFLWPALLSMLSLLSLLSPIWRNPFFLLALVIAAMVICAVV